jgi:hypothetical protein
MASTPVGMFLAAAGELLLLAKTIHDTGGPRSSSSFDAEEKLLKSRALPGGFGSAPTGAEAELMASRALPKSNRFRIDQGRANAISREAQANIDATRADTRIIVDFRNAPIGMRAKADPQSPMSVDFSMGYQLAGFGP